MSQVSINPLLTSNAAGSFNITSAGLIQGTSFDSPNIRNQLAGGVLKSDQTYPLWGGCGISELIPPVPGAAVRLGALGGTIIRATTLTAQAAGQLTGFSVFDQDHAMINSPQSPVPLAPQGGSVHFYRIGSNARIAVAMDPALVSLDGGLITQLVSWDFASQRLVASAPSHGALAISAMSWSAGVVSVTVAANSLVTGDTVSISGVNPAGYNGDFVITVVDGTHFTYALAVDPTAYVSGGQVDAGGGPLNVRVLETQVGNCMTVTFDPVTGFATWNRNGSCAVILI